MAEAARDYNWNFLERLGVRLVRQDVRDFGICSGRRRLRLYHPHGRPAGHDDQRGGSRTRFLHQRHGTFNVLKVARRTKIPIASCGTIHIYGNRINETLDGGGETLYSQAGGHRRNPPGTEGC